jgi:DNA-binding winged helix-turn-helix (wHTH) protein
VVYEAGSLEIDTGRRELRARGVPVSIGGRAFEIIEALARSAGELVTKDELMGAVWPGAIVEESTLQIHISPIRKALGPDRVMPFPAGQSLHVAHQRPPDRVAETSDVKSNA